MPRSFFFLFLLVATRLTGLAEAQEPTTLPERYDFSRRWARHDLPSRLNEISGLAFTPDGRLFAHGDERAWVHEIDPETGKVGKRFMLGDRTAQDDFEGMAIVGERFFLISSRGLLYEAREGEDRVEVPYRVTDTGLGNTCEVEGLEYHPGWDELLIPCKSTTPDLGAIVIHRMPISPDAMRRAPILVRRAALAAHGVDTDFHPSAIALDPATGTLVLVAAREEAILEISPEGRVIAALQLSQGRHPQVEGVAFGPDGTLYLADERNGRDARLTAYRSAQGPGAE